MFQAQCPALTCPAVLCCVLQGAVGRNAAQQCYLEALRQDVLYAPAWRGLGDLLREGGESVQALSCYQEAVRLRPCYADAFTGMGVVLKVGEAALCRAVPCGVLCRAVLETSMLASRRLGPD